MTTSGYKFIDAKNIFFEDIKKSRSFDLMEMLQLFYFVENIPETASRYIFLKAG